ncbi:MAG: tripartite tricarboxylate transporter substrate binding protein [Betaproteobacteria bacterium]|nr:tripartite tricarboxylate transporter substrate binding protein [Betaproteobacteria bacterium]
MRDRKSAEARRLHATARLLCVLTVTGAPIPVHSAAIDWKPERNVEIIVPAGAGGGNDRTARTLQKIWKEEKMLTVTTSVVNRPGGGHAVAYASLNNHVGDGHYLGVAQTNLLSNHITGKSSLRHSDVTALALLGTEYVAVAVRADSPIKTGKDLAERLKMNPASLSVSPITSLGNPMHITVAMVMKAIGADPRKLKTVIFNSGPESITALVGGHIDVISTLASNVVPQMQAGRLRVIGVSSPRRLSGPLAGAPTWKEQGIDAVAADWTAIIGPRDMSRGQIGYWESVFARLAAKDEWRRYVEASFWEHTFKNSNDTRAFMDAQYAETRGVLAELGLAK